MVALWNRADRYIFILWFLLFSSSFFFFRRLISAVGDWMSAILPHMVRVALVRISDAGLKRAARGSLEMQDAKIDKKSPSAHHRTTLSGYIFATKARIDNQKKLLSSNISSRCPHNMVNFGPLAAEIDPVVWGTPANFNGFRVLACSVTARKSSSERQPNFVRPWTEGVTYVRQGDHHVGHWPTFLVVILDYRRVEI